MKILQALVSRYGGRPRHLHTFTGAVALAALFSCPALAQAQDTGPEPERARGVWSVTSENDIFGGTDRNYSNGMRIERVSPANR